MSLDIQLLQEQLHLRAGSIRELLERYRELGRPFLLRTDLVETFEQWAHEANHPEFLDGPLNEWLRTAQEAVWEDSHFYVACRPTIARWIFTALGTETLDLQLIPAPRFLEVKERLREPHRHPEEWLLEIDLEPFSRHLPRLEQCRSIGQGAQFLNRHLSRELFADKERQSAAWLRFLRLHQHRGMQLMLRQSIDQVDRLQQSLRRALDWLETVDPATPWRELQNPLAAWGFEPGWGNDAARTMETMRLLADLLEAPSAALVEQFLSRLPMLFSAVILSPHGFFGQSNVLGRPDTGGQVVYILDQVRALEKAMRHSLQQQGLEVDPTILIISRLIPEADGTTCDQPTEPVEGTQNSFIVRVPFRNPDGSIVPHWISRFNIWPYLERFTYEVEREVRARLEGRPDMIIGNYSDGNLVASLLAPRLGVIQCNIAHALEKTKYLYSDLYWKDHESDHHFACQFTADLLAMNTADVLITSTYQEIAGTADSIGQYESYMNFTLPDLYRVINGIDPFDPRFNIVSPGADPSIFFPHTVRNRVPRRIREQVRTLIFGPPRKDALGELAEKSRPLLFAMSRLDRIKNMSGLVDWYGRHPTLRHEANLLLVGGQFDPDASQDAEEREQIQILHELIQRHHLQGHIRWVVMQTDKVRVGEFYRAVARQRGAFVQPALFEAFGLTVIEAMTSGLPVFATRYGGPLEIIQDGVSGFHIDPNHGEAAAERMAEFFRRCRAEPQVWDRISQAALARIQERYTWQLYANRLLNLCRIYGF